MKWLLIVTVLWATPGEAPKVVQHTLEADEATCHYNETPRGEYEWLRRMADDVEDDYGWIPVALRATCVLGVEV